MIHENKTEFMGAVSSIAEEWRTRSFESCLNGFMKSMISHCVAVDVPKNLDLGAREQVIKSVKETIQNSAKEFVHSALDPNEETGALYNVDVAHEITTPQNLNESIMKLLAAHIYDESKDRAQVLAAEFDAGVINNMNSFEALDHIKSMYANEGFDGRFANGVSFKSGVKELLSIEGEILVDDIKNDVSSLVSETEAKNSIIREAVAEINGKKAEIETKINGEAETPTGKDDDEDKKSDDSSDDTDSSNDENTTDDSVETPEEDSGNDEVASDDENSFEASAEGWNITAKRNIKKGNVVYTRESLYQINDLSRIAGMGALSEESLNMDKNTLSREAAENILDQFRELEDGIGESAIDSMGDNAFSVSDNNTDDGVGAGDTSANSAESDYLDDNSDIEVNSDAFNYQEIKPASLDEADDNVDMSEISEESIAKDLFPLNLNKASQARVKISKRLPVFLACQKDRGVEFFNQSLTRHNILLDMLSKSTESATNLPIEEIGNELKKKLDLCTNVKKDTETLVENMGILGILDGQYQRTDSHIDNAVASLFNANVLDPMGKDAAGNKLSVSTESLYEHDLADIFKLAVKKADITMELAGSKGVNVNSAKDELGYIDELLNEKIYSIVKPEDKDSVNEKIQALYSIECVCPMQEIANIQAFVSHTDGAIERPRITLDSFKDIDGYGYSYVDEIQKIKSDIKKKFDQVKDDKTNFNIDTDKIVEMVAEQMDTTKIDANLFEKTLSKLCENKTIETSTEALILRNKAKAIVTGYVMAEKLGYLRDSDIRDLNNYIM